MTLKKEAFRLLRAVATFGASTLGVGLIAGLSATARFRTRGLTISRGRMRMAAPAIFAFWHDQLLAVSIFAARRVRGVTMLISRHPDADSISRIMEKIDVVPIRGSSSRGGHEAMGELVRRLREGVSTGITPDGPRGPRHRAGNGIIVVARRSGVPIVPVGFALRPRLLAGSWDRMQIPLPFSRVGVVAGEPIVVPKGAGAEQREKLREDLEGSLNRVTAQAESVAAGG